MRCEPVIVVPMEDQIAAALSDAEISFRAQGRSAVKALVPNARIRWDEVLDADITVVEDDKLTVRIVLSQEIADGLRQPSPPAGGGHDAGNERIHISHRT